VIVPSYNSGRHLLPTVRAALRQWSPVWVVVDGSDDGSDDDLAALAAREPGLRVLRRRANGGKGAAVLDGLRLALREGYRHALVMDADGQHPAERIPEFFGLARACGRDRTLVLGLPRFAADAPRERVYGRRVGNAFARLATLGGAGVIGDSLFGFRVYPVAATVALMERIRTARRYDFDTEVAVRLCWEGFATVNVPVPVRYPSRREGGVSHFRYLRDNWLLIRTHARLLGGRLRRLVSRLFLRRA